MHYNLDIYIENNIGMLHLTSTVLHAWNWGEEKHTPSFDFISAAPESAAVQRAGVRNNFELLKTLI